MKMDLAGPGGAQALRVAACQSQPVTSGNSSMHRAGGNKNYCRVQFHNIIMLCHNPSLVAHKINVRDGSYHSCCLDLMVTVNYSFPPIDLPHDSC